MSDYDEAPECRTLGCGNLAVAGEYECDECKSPIRVIEVSARWVDDELYSQIGDHPGRDHEGARP